MKRYNLERGEVNSKAHHIDTQEYYRHINAAVKAAEMEIKDVTMPVVELPPALIGREAYQKQLQTQLFDYWLKISKISKQKELKVLSSEQKAKRLELAKKVEKSPLLASRLNSQPVIRQQPQQGEQRRNRGMHM
jgi:hypothetical protein